MSQMSTSPVVRPSVVKSTYKHLSEVLSAYWSGDRVSLSPWNSLIDLLHVSPRLTQWAKIAEGYRIWSIDEAMSVTVTPEKIYTTKGIRVDDLQSGLPAQTLYKTIETAQGIVQAHGSTEKDEDFFVEEPEYVEGAGLDAALVDSHNLEPVNEDDVELIEDVTAEDALDADQRQEDGPSPIVSVSQKFIEDLTEQDESDIEMQNLTAVNGRPGYTVKINKKNATTDGVQCPHCGNLNRDSYKGTCPQCPKDSKSSEFMSLIGQKVEKALPKGTVQESYVQSRLKSLQGRVLTIIDGCFSDKTQREAVKTQIKKEFRREIGTVGGGE